MIVYARVGECTELIHYVHPNRVTGGMQMAACMIGWYTLDFLLHLYVLI